MTPQILFVDDEAYMRELLSLYLRHEGMEVTAVATGQQARELFCQVAFDLTILDLHLAGADGWDVLNFIKRSDSQHPVIIYTGVDEDELVMKKTLLGRANAVVRKSASLASLLAEVRQHLPQTSSTEEPLPTRWSWQENASDRAIHHWK